jgi:hypothetical protein
MMVVVMAFLVLHVESLTTIMAAHQESGLLVLVLAYQAFRPAKVRIHQLREGLQEPKDCHWAFLDHSRSHNGFRAFLGVPPELFDEIAARFEPLYLARVATASNRGPKRSLTPRDVLAMTLHYLRTGCEQDGLCRQFGPTPAPCCRELNHGLASLHATLRGWDEAEIRWPTLAEMAIYSAMITRRHPHLHNCFAFLDGAHPSLPQPLFLNLESQILNPQSATLNPPPSTLNSQPGLNVPMYEPTNPGLQSSYFNDWLGGCFCSQVILYLPDGTIAWATYNWPGSQHDSRLAAGLYRKLDSSATSRDGVEFRVAADAAFKGGKHVFKPLKVDQVLPLPMSEVPLHDFLVSEATLKNFLMSEVCFL